MNDAWDVEVMVRELVEYELNFLALSDLIELVPDGASMPFHQVIVAARDKLEKKYRSIEYDALYKTYVGVFRWPETDEDFRL